METARQAIADYAADAMNSTPALWGLAYRVDNMVSAVLSTKNGMPEVVDDPQSWWVPGDWFDGDGGVAAAEQRAQQHMATTYVDPAVSVDAQVPVLPQPRDPVAVDDGGGQAILRLGDFHAAHNRHRALRWFDVTGDGRYVEQRNRTHLELRPASTRGFGAVFAGWIEQAERMLREKADDAYS
ncbi:hypothetical protein [Nocardia sp. X0981]